MQRRSFIGHLLGSGRKRVRPPYANAHADFSACAWCPGYCLDACQGKTGVLARDNEGVPFLDFDTAGCTFCGACRDVCPEGVLGDVETLPLANFWISDASCLAHNGTVCVSCAQACPENAIKLAGLLRPRILAEACTGCGACVSVCPVEAIRWSA